MKNISLVLNAILIVAVAFLFYKNFSDGKSENADSENKNDYIASPIVPLSSSAIAALPKGVPFAFINADTIFAKYELAKKAKASGEGKVANYQKTYQAKAEAFQKEYNDYMEKAGAGGYTKEQGLAIEARLQKKKEEIVDMEQNQDKVMSEVDNSNVDVQKKIYDFLTKFNKEHGYYCVLAYTRTGGGVLGINDSLDVTIQVLSGLNAEYNASKGNK